MGSVNEGEAGRGGDDMLKGEREISSAVVCSGGGRRRMAVRRLTCVE